MATWITSIETTAGDHIGFKEDRWLGEAIYDLWDEHVLQAVEDGKETFQYRLTGKAEPVLERMKKELKEVEQTTLQSDIELFTGIVERLSALELDTELYIELFDW